MANDIITNIPAHRGQPGYKYVDLEAEYGDRPEKAEIAPGVEYAPSEGWTLEAISRAFPDAFDFGPEEAARIDRGEPLIDERVAEGKTRQMAIKYGPLPPDWNVPDYSAEGRERMEQNVFGQIGGNPFTLDPFDEVKKATAQLPSIFDQIFRGQVLYQDRDKMSSKQRTHWEKEKARYRASVHNDAKAMQGKMMKEYEWIMNQWDRRAKAWKDSRDKLDKESGRTIDVFNDELDVKDKVTMEEFAGLQKEHPGWRRGKPMEDKPEKGATISDLEKLFDFEKDMLEDKNLTDDGKVQPDALRAANRMRLTLDLPPIEEIAGEKPAWGLVKRWWEKNMPGPLGGGDVPEVGYREAATGTPDIPPDGTTGTHQGRKVTVKDGKWVYM